MTTSLRRNSHVSASRKKLVTLIRIVSKSCSNSSGVRVEVVAIAAVLVDLQRLHPLADAAGEAGALVAREVEAAASLQVTSSSSRSGCSSEGDGI